MIFHGKVKNGVIVLDGDARLPEGVEVRVDLLTNGSPDRNGAPAMSLYDSFKSFIGSAKGLPPDAARNVDHYLYGHPKE